MDGQTSGQEGKMIANEWKSGGSGTPDHEKYITHVTSFYNKQEGSFFFFFYKENQFH